MSKHVIHPFTGDVIEVRGDSLPPPPPPSRKQEDTELTQEDAAPWGYILENGYFSRF